MPKLVASSEIVVGSHWAFLANFTFDDGVVTSDVVDMHFVDKIGDKTAILKEYDMSTKILFCRHNNVLYWRRKDTFKTKYT